MNQEVRNRIAEVVIVSVVLVAAWFVVAEPTHARVRDSAARLALLEAETERYESSRTLAPEQSAALEQRIDHLLSVGAPRDTLEHHETLLSMARDHALDVERVNPGKSADPLSVGPIRIGARRVHLEATGTFADACAFLSRLTREAPMTVIEHFSITPHTHGRDRDAEVTLSAWIKVGGVTLDRANLAEAPR